MSKNFFHPPSFIATALASIATASAFTATAPALAGESPAVLNVACRAVTEDLTGPLVISQNFDFTGQPVGKTKVSKHTRIDGNVAQVDISPKNSIYMHYLRNSLDKKTEKITLEQLHFNIVNDGIEDVFRVEYTKNSPKTSNVYYITWDKENNATTYTASGDNFSCEITDIDQKK